MTPSISPRSLMTGPPESPGQIEAVARNLASTMVSMLATVVMDSGDRRVAFVHACRSSRVHAFREWLDDVAADHPNVSKVTFYERVAPEDTQGRDFDFEGRLVLAKIRDAVLLRDADYYVCGPMPFMRAQVDALKALGVDASRIQTEVFGVGDLR